MRVRMRWSRGSTRYASSTQNAMKKAICAQPKLKLSRNNWYASQTAATPPSTKNVRSSALSMREGSSATLPI